MEIVPVSEFPAATTLTGAEIIPLVQSGVTKRSTVGALSTALTAARAHTLTYSAQAINNTAGPGVTLQSLTAVQFDTSGGGPSAGARTPSGTKGQALARTLVSSGTSGPGVGADVYASGAAFYRDVSGTGTNGFTMDAMVMIEAITNTQCVFFGVCSIPNNSMFNSVTEPSQLTQIAAFAKDSADTYLQFMLRATGTVTKIPLTGVTVASLVNHLLQVHIEATATEVSYQLTDLETGLVIASGSSSLNMPATDSQVYVHLAVQANPIGAATDCKLGFYKLDIGVTP